ncbi:hypothetical protein [Streptomyces sp. NPDC056661]|uniref:hypothetical protein n=1 Tax=Streptomyces sp. NPDC056661 TaxID=3345898 RepID=UPI0036CDF91C
MRYRLKILAILASVLSLIGVLATTQPAAALGSGSWLPVKIASAPAVAYLGPAIGMKDQNQLNVVRGEDNRIYYSVEWIAKPEAGLLGWIEVPGGGKTPYEVSLHSDMWSEKVYAAAVGMNGNGVWVQTYDWHNGWSGTWENWGGVFSSPPEIATFADEVTVLASAKADGNKLYYRRQPKSVPVDPSGSNWHRWTNTIVTTKKVAARYFRRTTDTVWTDMMVTARGEDSKIYQCISRTIFNTTNWKDCAWTEIPGGGRTNHGLAMAEWSTPERYELPDVLWLGSTGTDGKVYYQSYQNGCWNGGAGCPSGGWRNFPTQGNTVYGPGMYTLGTVNGFSGPVVAVTETPAQKSGIAYQISRPDLVPGQFSHTKLKSDPGFPGWWQASHSDYGQPGSGTNPEEIAAGWDPSWKDANGNPIPSPVNGPNAINNSEPVNQWYPWCQIWTDGVNPTGNRTQQWMPGENSTDAFNDLVAWLDVYFPIGSPGPDGPGGETRWHEQNGYC